MSAKLTSRQVGDVTVIDAGGRITLGEGASAFRDIIRDMAAKGNKKLLLNLSEVSYIDSSGIGDGFGIYHRNQQWRSVKVVGVIEASKGSAADYQVVYRFRSLRRRSRGRSEFQLGL